MIHIIFCKLNAKYSCSEQPSSKQQIFHSVDTVNTDTSGLLGHKQSFGTSEELQFSKTRLRPKTKSPLIRPTRTKVTSDHTAQSKITSDHTVSDKSDLWSDRPSRRKQWSEYCIWNLVCGTKLFLIRGSDPLMPDLDKRPFHYTEKAEMNYPLLFNGGKITRVYFF